MLLQQNYTVTVTYTDPLNQSHTQILKVPSITAGSKIAFPDIDYPDFVNASVEGQLAIADGSTPAMNVSLKCDAVDKSNKTVQLTTTSTPNGKYNFSF
jgi:hypothetical protein